MAIFPQVKGVTSEIQVLSASADRSAARRENGPHEVFETLRPTRAANVDRTSSVVPMMSQILRNLSGFELPTLR